MNSRGCLFILRGSTGLLSGKSSWRGYGEKVRARLRLLLQSCIAAAYINLKPQAYHHTVMLQRRKDPPYFFFFFFFVDHTEYIFIIRIELVMPLPCMELRAVRQ